jgi:hypothetical protein
MVHVNGFLQENYDRVRCAFRGNVVGNKICLHSSGYYENVPLCLRVGLQLAVNLYHYLYYYPSLVLEFHGCWISWFGNEVERKSSLVGYS